MRSSGGGIQYRVFYNEADFSPCQGPQCLSYFAACETNITTSVSTISGTWGVTDTFDLGVAVPFVHTRVEGRARFVDLAANGVQTAVNPVTASGSSSGVGDITIRAKYAAWKGSNAALAVSSDLRVGTGQDKRVNLLGTNDLQERLLLSGSFERGAVSPHFNLGYGFSRHLNDEFHYAVGTDVRWTERITFSADLVGRVLRDNATCDGAASEVALGGACQDGVLNTLGIVDLPLQNRRSGGAVPGFAEAGAFQSEAALVRGNRNLLLGVVGAKVRVAGQFLLMANVLIQTNSVGFKPSPALVLGFERSFGADVQVQRASR